MGAMLMAVGGLIVALCGTCTVAFQVSIVFDWVRGLRGGWVSGFRPILLLPLMYGTAPIVLGIVLFVAGRRLRRVRVPAPDTDTGSASSC